MVYFKCALTGLAAAMLTAVVWSAVAAFRAISSEPLGAGAVSGGAVEIGLLPRLAALAMFAAGFLWCLRRERRASRP